MRFTQVLIFVTAILMAAGCSYQNSESSPKQPSESGVVKANGIRIAYDSHGSHDREVIILIGGTGSQLIDWPVEMVDELVRRGYRVVRFDNRDSGLSTRFDAAGLPDYQAMTAALEKGDSIPAPYRLEDMAADTIGLMDALQIEKAHIVGISMGGMIAQLIAIQYPEKTRSLTLMMSGSGNLSIPAVAKPDALKSIPALPAKDDEDAYVEYKVKVAQAIGSPVYPELEKDVREKARQGFERGFDPAALARQQYVSLAGYFEGEGSRRSKLHTITARTVILQGDSDVMVDAASARDLASLIPEAELIIVKGLGHNIPIQLVQTFADAITTAAGAGGTT